MEAAQSVTLRFCRKRTTKRYARFVEDAGSLKPMTLGAIYIPLEWIGDTDHIAMVLTTSTVVPGITDGDLGTLESLEV